MGELMDASAIGEVLKRVFQRGEARKERPSASDF
jgi:hypothetical protein